jgi:pyridoxal phosphate enzyme (YggS family)
MGDLNDSIRERLRANLDVVEERILRACERGGRRRSDVTLVAVTKSVDVAIAGMLVELGLRDLGENRPQELWRKSAALPNDVRWHLIGHLQRNKIERTLPLMACIHAVDSVRLLQALDAEAARQNRRVPVLLEVNASGEASKQGFQPGDVPALVPILREIRNLEVRGLMTMAALQDAEACRPTFAALRDLRDQLRAELAGVHAVEHLSMGMSNDFEIAIEEGATFVRLGTVLFEGIA